MAILDEKDKIEIATDIAIHEHRAYLLRTLKALDENVASRKLTIENCEGKPEPVTIMAHDYLMISRLAREALDARERDEQVEEAAPSQER